MHRVPVPGGAVGPEEDEGEEEHFELEEHVREADCEVVVVEVRGFFADIGELLEDGEDDGLGDGNEDKEFDGEELGHGANELELGFEAAFEGEDAGDRDTDEVGGEELEDEFCGLCRGAVGALAHGGDPDDDGEEDGDGEVLEDQEPGAFEPTEAAVGMFDTFGPEAAAALEEVVVALVCGGAGGEVEDVEFEEGAEGEGLGYDGDLVEVDRGRVEDYGEDVADCVDGGEGDDAEDPEGFCWWGMIWCWDSWKAYNFCSRGMV